MDKIKAARELLRDYREPMALPIDGDDLAFALSDALNRINDLERCLRWYADGRHLVGFEGWGSCSGKPPNWLYMPSDADCFAGIVENGGIAQGVLDGKPVDWGAERLEAEANG